MSSSATGIRVSPMQTFPLILSGSLVMGTLLNAIVVS